MRWATSCLFLVVDLPRSLYYATQGLLAYLHGAGYLSLRLWVIWRANFVADEVVYQGMDERFLDL